MVRELRGCAAEVKTAGSSEEAMREVADFTPDVMVVDIEMRGEAGYDFIGRVRAQGPVKGGRTPAVALSSRGRAEDRVRTLRAGFQIHVTKPVPPLELASVLARLGPRKPPTPDGAGGDGR
jgi:CheY-like chemotaxis protein